MFKTASQKGFNLPMQIYMYAVVSALPCSLKKY